MLWIDSVPSLRYQATSTTIRNAAYRLTVPAYGTPSATCRPSAAIVPKTATDTAASQYTAA